MTFELTEKDLLVNIVTKTPAKKHRIKSVLIFFFIVGLIVPLYYFSISDFFGYNTNTNDSLILNSSDQSEIMLDFCNLEDVNPWDPTVSEFIKPQKDPMLNCTPKIFEHSKLINGQLFLFSHVSTSKENSKTEMNCRMRCLYLKGSMELTYGNWINVTNGTNVECDTIVVECQKDEKVFYRYWHAQVYRKSPPSSVSEPQKKYNVHLFVLDAAAHTQFIRALPQTVHLLREQYEAFSFRHLNKVGISSFPNAFAFLFGKMIEHIPKSAFSKGHVAQYSGYEYACGTVLDNEQFIGFRYQDDGYVTMLAEDWLGGIFNYGNCFGFSKPQFNHTMKPFQIHSEKNGNEANYVKGVLYNESCHEPHPYICDYLKSFLRAYPDKPKFSLTWLTQLAHSDQRNDLSTADDYFYQFFNDTLKDFENSFLFIMGDHGQRAGKRRETVVGEAEDFNPALFLSVPKSLRNDRDFMHQLKINSKELITHFDIYATLNELVQPKAPRITNPLLLGSSLLHPLPYPRTCDSLRIPFEFCICRFKRTTLPETNKIGIPASKLMIDQINHELFSSNISKICSKLSLNETAKVAVEDYGGDQPKRVYKITFITQPGNAKFWGVVSYDPSNHKTEIISTKFMRLDMYRDQAKCAVKFKLASYCHCIN